MTIRFWAAAIAAVFGLGMGQAEALTAYMLPRAFAPTGDIITVDAGYASNFFSPQIGISSPDMHVDGPAGGRSGFDAANVDAQHSSFDFSIGDEGTYHFTTGQILGPVTTMVGENGAWRALAPGETPAADAQTQTLQTVTVADTYISKVRPTDPPLTRQVGRLAIRPITHPNRISVATGFEVELMLDGQPLPNMAIVLYAQGDPETKLDRFVTTGADGHATFTFTTPGVYMAAVRYRAAAPAGAAAQVQSYTTTLTFQVLQDLPPIPPPPRQPQRHRAWPY
ncbi:MAG: DUF4198 domain-containing protein [Alphaproteobacteria bacterium]